MIFFGRRLDEYAKVSPVGVRHIDICGKEGLLRAEHFNFEPVKKSVFLETGFVFITQSGELCNEFGKMGLFSGKIKDIARNSTNTHFALVDENDDVYTWGWGMYGQLGLGDTDNEEKPVLMEKDFFNNEKIQEIRLGYKHSMALTQNNNLYVWGCNSAGKLGFGEEYEYKERLERPTLLSKSSFDHKKIIQIATGDNHLLALTDDGNIYSWGMNLKGQLGLVSDEGVMVNTPTHIKPDNFNREKIVKIVAGGAHSLALTETGALYAWGDNSYGQLGCGNNPRELTPKRVILNKKVDDILDDICNFSLAIIEGKLYAWGNGGKAEPEVKNLL